MGSVNGDLECFIFDIIDDNIPEPLEDIIIHIFTDQSNIVFHEAYVRLFIIDDDPPGK